MIYGIDAHGYVRQIWQTAPPIPTPGLTLLEIDHADAPTVGNWRVSNGMLVALPSTIEAFERRKERVAMRRALLQ
jgi:hypothetical protein